MSKFDLNKAIEYCNKQYLTIIIKDNNKLINIEKVDNKLFLSQSSFYIVHCSKHPNAYSNKDPEAGKISKMTFSRRINDQKPLCVCCRAEYKGCRASLHLGARFYQSLATQNTDFCSKKNKPKRSEITDGYQHYEIYCTKCKKNTSKSASDISNPRADGCNNPGCSTKDAFKNSIKYTLKQIINLIENRGIKFLGLVNVNYKKIKHISDEESDNFTININKLSDEKLNKKTSVNLCAKITCPIHRRKGEKITRIHSILDGKSGCKKCSQQISVNEKIVLSVINAFIDLNKIELHYNSKWLGKQHLDIFIPSQNIAIEVQGTQHYKKDNFYNKKKGSLNKLQLNDKRKAEKCKKNNVNIIQYDASDVENRAKFENCVHICAEKILPILNKYHPNIYPIYNKTPLIKDKLAQSTSNILCIIKSEFHGRKKKELDKYCKKRGLIQESQYVSETTKMSFRCKHQLIESTPANIKKASGKYCCTIAANGEKPNEMRAIKAAAIHGFYVDIDQSVNDNKCVYPPKLAGKSKFHVSCLCGKFRYRVTINTLDSKYQRCKCSNLTNENLMKLYVQRESGEYEFNMALFNKEKSNAKILMQLINNDKLKIISNAIKNPEFGREKLFKFLLDNHIVNSKLLGLTIDSLTHFLKKCKLNNPDLRRKARYKNAKNLAISCDSFFKIKG